MQKIQPGRTNKNVQDTVTTNDPDPRKGNVKTRSNGHGKEACKSNYRLIIMVIDMHTSINNLRGECVIKTHYKFQPGSVETC